MKSLQKIIPILTLLTMTIVMIILVVEISNVYNNLTASQTTTETITIQDVRYIGHRFSTDTQIITSEGKTLYFKEKLISDLIIGRTYNITYRKVNANNLVFLNAIEIVTLKSFGVSWSNNVTNNLSAITLTKEFIYGSEKK